MPQAISNRLKIKTGLNGDFIFKGITVLFAFSILVILFLMIYEMVSQSLPSITKSGWRFITGQNWDAVQEDFGALPYIYGSVVSSVLALALATPLSVGSAVFITEIAPKRLGAVMAALVELLAAIPSVIYGLWGVLVMAPWLQQTVQPFLIEHFGFLPFFQGAPYGVSMLAAIFILMIMVVPIITSISREVLLAVPLSQKEAAIALGATRWEMIRMAVLTLWQIRHPGRGYSRHGQGHRRNHGRHHGHRQYAADIHVAPVTRLHHAQRHCQ